MCIRDRFSSIHANSCRDALRRLETMVLMGMDMPLGAIQGLIASSVDILIHLGRCLNGERKILEISEIKDYSRTEYKTHTLFQYDKDHGLEKMCIRDSNKAYKKGYCINGNHLRVMEDEYIANYKSYGNTDKPLACLLYTSCRTVSLTFIQLMRQYTNYDNRISGIVPSHFRLPLYKKYLTTDRYSAK